jgi:hypothetical protein
VLEDQFGNGPLGAPLGGGVELEFLLIIWVMLTSVLMAQNSRTTTERMVTTQDHDQATPGNLLWKCVFL